MKNNKPLHRNNLILKDLGDEFLIYSSEYKELHVVNPTARLIWDLCDGEHTIDEIENEVRANFSIPQDADVAGDILNTLDIFQKKGLLED